jgi:undecaprenyl-diphosphatase
MPEIDAALTAWINAGAGRFPPVDFIMIWISAIGVPLLVVAVALQWWVPRSDHPTRHVLVAARVDENPYTDDEHVSLVASCSSFL